MKNTTLCYIKQNDKYLMLHRTKKSDDPNEGKWIGIGGHMSESFFREDCKEIIKQVGIKFPGYYDYWSFYENCPTSHQRVCESFSVNTIS